MKFGECVANRRRELGLSQKELANLIHVSSSCLCRIEHGELKPSADLRLALTDALGMESESFDLDTVNLAILEKRVNNAIYELELALDVIKTLKKERFDYV